MRTLKGTKRGTTLLVLGGVAGGFLLGIPAGSSSVEVTKTSEYVELERQTNQLMEDVETAESKADTYRQDGEDLQKQVTTLTEKVKAQEDLQKTVDDLTSQVSSLTSERDSYQAQLTDAQAQLTEAQTQLASNQASSNAADTSSSTVYSSGGTTSGSSAESASNTYYKNCSAARAVGAAPIYAGQPGYRSGLDRDNDGVACEN